MQAQTERDGLFSEYRGLIYTVARLTDKPVNSKHEAEEAVTSTLEFISNLKQEVSKKLGMMEKQIAVLEEAHSQQGLLSLLSAPLSLQASPALIVPQVHKLEE